MKYVIFLISTFFLLAQASAQKNFKIEEHIDRIVRHGDEVSNENYYNTLLFYFENPIDLNKASPVQLEQLGILATEQIEAIIKHRQATGDFMSTNELQSITALSLDDIRRVVPFLTVGRDNSLKSAFAGLTNKKLSYITTDYSRVSELARGYLEDIYAGSPEKAQLRVRLRNPGKLSLGLTAQKDAGEPWVFPRTGMPDFLSGHIFLENQQRLNQLVLGDYRLQFGQGLVLGSGFMTGKNVETVRSVRQTTLGVMPYNSISESGFFRGIATNIKVTNQLSTSFFYSNRNLDGTLRTIDFRPAISAVRTSGFHRTASELEARNALNEQVWGIATTYRRSNLLLGGLAINTLFDLPIQPTNYAGNLHKFTGRRLTNFSVFGEYQLENIGIFGEVAQTTGAGRGISLGIISSISRFISLSVAYRDLASDFHSLYGYTFAERSTLANERGFYWGLKIYPLRRFTISAYYDMYTFPWITGTTSRPVSGTDYLIRGEFKLSKDKIFFLQVRSEQSEFDKKGVVSPQSVPFTLTKSILNFDYGLEQSISYRTRIQYNRYNEEILSHGWLIYQDINYSNMRWGITGRVLFFDTDSYSARQYVYEKDMLFTFNTRGFSGRGLNYYLILKVKPSKNLSLRAKWSFTEYLDQNSIGSGYDLIDGNTKTQLSAQLYYRF